MRLRQHVNLAVPGDNLRIGQVKGLLQSHSTAQKFKLRIVFVKVDFAALVAVVVGLGQHRKSPVVPQTERIGDKPKSPRIGQPGDLRRLQCTRCQQVRDRFMDDADLPEFRKFTRHRLLSISPDRATNRALRQAAHGKIYSAAIA